VTLRRVISLAIVVALVGAFVVATAGPPEVTVNAPGTFAFGAFGDAPYDVFESARYPLMLEDLDRHDLAFSIHVGDIFWRPCSQDRYERSLRWFNELQRPLIYVPGDNEWADCWTRQEGGFDPRDRLALLRRVLYPRPGFALGRTRFQIEVQANDPAFPEFVEHTRWSHDGIIFATIHVVGSDNFTLSFPGRTAADDEEARRRLAAALAWLRDTFARGKSASTKAVVVAFHADPGFDGTLEDQAPFRPLLDAFEDETVAFAKPVLLIHGDSHHFITDHPLKARAGGRTIPNVTRLEVPGSPDVGWVRVIVTAGVTPSFAFEQRIVPFWKFW
jgi:Calcineurin-like phosphoesterase